MMERGFSLSRFVGVGLLAAIAQLAGCGSSAPAAKTPTPAARPTASAAPTATTAAPAAQAGVAPSSGAESPLYQQGVAAYASGDLAGAKSALQQAILRDPRSVAAHHSLGVVLERLEDTAAGSEYRQALALQPTHEPSIVAYALWLARRGQLSEAESFLSGKRGSMPRSAAVIGALAEVKSMGRDTASAQQLAQEALKMDSNYRPAMVTIARDHYRNRRLDLSLYALQAILDGFGDDNPPRDRNNADAHALRGLIMKEEGRRAAAIAEFRQAVALRPDLVDPRVELAASLLEAGNASEALPLLEGAVRYSANNTVARLSLGDAYRLLGRPSEAKAQFDWVLSHDATLAQTHYNLALLYLFSPSVPGLDAKRQADEAVVEIQKYQQMRGRLNAGQADDSEELLNRAKQKQADLAVQQGGGGKAPAPASSAPGPGASSAPAAAPAAGPAVAAPPTAGPGARAPAVAPPANAPKNPGTTVAQPVPVRGNTAAAGGVAIPAAGAVRTNPPTPAAPPRASQPGRPR